MPPGAIQLQPPRIFGHKIQNYFQATTSINRSIVVNKVLVDNPDDSSNALLQIQVKQGQSWFDATWAELLLNRQVVPPRVNLRIFPINGGTKASVMIEQSREVAKAESVTQFSPRLVVGSRAIEDDLTRKFCEDSPVVSVLLCYQSAEPFGWGGTQGEAIGAIHTQLPDIGMACHDVLLDLCLAHSSPFRDRIAKLTPASISRCKVIFARRNRFKSYLGTIREDAGYISFASCARTKPGPLGAADIDRCLQYWTDFCDFMVGPEGRALLCEEGQLLPPISRTTSESVVEMLQQIPASIRHQISVRRLLNQINRLPPGICFVCRVMRRPRSIADRQALATAFRKTTYRSGMIAPLDFARFQSLERYIKDGTVQYWKIVRPAV